MDGRTLPGASNAVMAIRPYAERAQEENIAAFARGERYRLEITNNNFNREPAQFTATKAAAQLLRRELRAKKMRAGILEISVDGSSQELRRTAEGRPPEQPMSGRVLMGKKVQNKL